MRQTLVSTIACLALCAAGAGALIATHAHAQTTRKPIMIALTTPAEAHAMKAAPAPDAGGMAARRAGLCHDMYAHEVGALAYLGAKFSFTPAQNAAFERWKNVKLDIARRHQAACGQRMAARGDAPSVTGRLAREQAMLEGRLADIKQERPALDAFYNSLSDTQKAQFGQDGRMVRRRVMLGMLARPGMPGMDHGPGPMDQGPMDHGMTHGPDGMPPTP